MTKMKMRTVQVGSWNKGVSPWGFDITIKEGTDMGGVFTAVWKTGDAFCKVYARLTADQMKLSVWPGKGPGPHPHRTSHEDTGWAFKSITIRRRKHGVSGPSPGWFAGVFSDRRVGKPGGRAKRGATPPWKYLFFLEFGWTSRSGKRYRYPWAQPAYAWAAKKRVGRIAGPSGLFISSR